MRVGSHHFPVRFRRGDGNNDCVAAATAYATSNGARKHGNDLRWRYVNHEKHRGHRFSSRDHTLAGPERARARLRGAPM